MKPVMRELIERLLGPRGIMRLRRFARGQERPRWGNLRRLAPFSTRYGFDRGTPVDRYYLDRFLDGHRSLITGQVLEIQTDGHARRYGRDLERIDTVDISGEFRPTYLCDLASSGVTAGAKVTRGSLFTRAWSSSTHRRSAMVLTGPRNSMRIGSAGSSELAARARS